MAADDNKGLYRLLQVSVALSAFTVVLLAIGLILTPVGSRPATANCLTGPRTAFCVILNS